MKCNHGIDIEEDCPQCNDIIAQIGVCERCGDGIPKKQMKEHLEWCMVKINDAPTRQLRAARDMMIEAHRNNTRWDDRPYYVHPDKVVDILQTRLNVHEINIICAGYLHDVLEDTSITYDVLKEKFGEIVAEYVLELTHKDDISDEEYINSCARLSEGGKLIKIADILANLTDLGMEKQSNHFVRKRLLALQAMIAPENKKV